MRAPGALVELAEEGVARAERMGADAAEVYVWSARGDRIMQAGRLRLVHEADQSGIGVRLLRGTRLASASTTGVEEDDLVWALERAAASAHHVPPSHLDRFATCEADPGPPTSVDPRVVDPDMDQLVDFVDALAQDVQGSPGIDYHEIIAGAYRGTFAVANSQGASSWDRGAHERCTLEVRFESGGVHRYARAGAYVREPLNYKTHMEQPTAEALALVAATRDRGALDGSVTTVVLDAVAASALLFRLVPALSGLEAARGRTHFSDALGEPVAVEALTLVDDARSEQAIRAQRSDDEGVTTKRAPLIEDGVLRQYIYDWSGALEAEAAPTGHGLRPRSKRFAANPGPSTCNLEVEPGDWRFEEMVESVDRGLFVKGPFLGSFTSSPITGDFSLVAPLCFAIEDGEMRHAVPSATVAGNLYDALKTIRALGRDPVRLAGGSCVPLLVDGVTGSA